MIAWMDRHSLAWIKTGRYNTSFARHRTVSNDLLRLRYLIDVQRSPACRALDPDAQDMCAPSIDCDKAESVINSFYLPYLVAVIVTFVIPADPGSTINASPPAPIETTGGLELVHVTDPVTSRPVTFPTA
jgi:hypothetical protein